IRYGTEGLPGSRVFDFEIFDGAQKRRLYSLLDYTKFTLLIFGSCKSGLKFPDYVKVIHVSPIRSPEGFWTEDTQYANQAILVRPDSYIQSAAPLEKIESLFENSLFELARL
ncbi:MAG: hypothetical protein K2X81_10455, partial [Candidatus Obscuribacterales bacterium]|nr:hypothetical protein [Candidatus Obscuribacterales bacterium]